jgi:hypothetical protein
VQQAQLVLAEAERVGDVGRGRRAGRVREPRAPQQPRERRQIGGRIGGGHPDLDLELHTITVQWYSSQ